MFCKIFNRKLGQVFLLIVISVFFISLNLGKVSGGCHRECTCLVSQSYGCCVGISGVETGGCVQGTCTRCISESCVWVDCCDNSCNGSCSNFRCPEGQSTTDSGYLCKQALEYCTYKNDCDNTCTKRGSLSCYLPETNDQSSPPSKPSYISMIIDGKTYQLSTNPETPTNIDIKSLGTSLDTLKANENITEKIQNTPSTSRDSTSFPPSDGSPTYLLHSGDGILTLGASGTGDDVHLRGGSIVKDGERYRMWYSGYDGSKWRIYYASSGDSGITWVKRNNTVPTASNTTSTEGRIALGLNGTGDDAHVKNPSVIKDGDTYKMWYAGSDGSTWRIYYATSPDGLTWTKYNNTVPLRSDITSTDGRLPIGNKGKGDDAHIEDLSVIKDVNTYKMWYSASDGSNYRIYYATSPDGLTWTKYNNATASTRSNTTSTNGQLPLGTSGTGDDVHLLGLSVIKDSGAYKMWYSASDGSKYRIYYALSYDGINWEKINNSIPSASNTTSTEGRIPLGANGTGDDAHVYNPMAIQDGENYYVWYSGNNGSNARIFGTRVRKDYIIQMTMPFVSKPSTARALGYEFKVDNYGRVGSWVDNLTDCSSLSGEDQCVSNDISSVEEFIPSSVPLSQVLAEGASGKITGTYYHLDKCDDDRVYSEPITGYYQLNIPATPVTPCETDLSISTDDPRCTDSKDVCPMEADAKCTIDEVVREKELCNDITPLDTWYSGLELNNPMKIRLAGADKDGVEDIRGFVIWLSKDSSVPEILPLSSTFTNSDTEDLGIMILRNNSEWSNPKIYGYSEGKWGILPEEDSMLKVTNGSNEIIAAILKNNNDKYVNIYKGSIVTMEIELAFFNSSSLEQLGGTYAFNMKILDSGSVYEGDINTGDIKRYFNWGIDLVKPVFNMLKESIEGTQKFVLNWEIDGTISKVTNFIINAYRLGGIETSSISSGTFIPIEFDPDQKEIKENDIGIVGSENSWQYYVNPPVSPYAANAIINIGTNELGTISMYASTYDQACNFNYKVLDVSLDPWIATLGGMVYSAGGLGSSPKDVTTISGGLLGILNIPTEHIDTGTELVSSRRDYLNNLIHPEIEGLRGGFRAVSTYDSNDRKSYWFEYFKTKLEKRAEDIGNGIGEIFSLVESCPEGMTACYLYSKESVNVPSGYQCDGKILIMSEQDIVFEPDVWKGYGMKGCIFIAKNDIVIKEGTYKSGYGLEYDNISGFLLAENQIRIESGDKSRSIPDGIKINGGMVSFGKNLGEASAINLERNIKLYTYIYPTLVVEWDIQYAKISEIFFGTDVVTYKQEVGFKTY